MNEKQITDLIERMRELGHIYSYQGAKNLIQEYEKLNKPEKVTIPQFVADWIEEARKTTYNIRGAIEMAPNGRVKDWLELKNVNIFAEAWVNGYEVEKEKRYVVTLKNRQPLVKSQSGSILYFSQDITAGNYKVTKKELEEANFGWVFDCSGIEVQEVE